MSQPVHHRNEQEGENGRLVHDGLTAEQLEELAAVEADAEEADAIVEFQRRLDYNMGRVRQLVSRLAQKLAGPDNLLRTCTPL